VFLVRDRIYEASARFSGPDLPARNVALEYGLIDEVIDRP
jgi:hypothetical protein